MVQREAEEYPADTHRAHLTSEQQKARSVSFAKKTAASMRRVKAKYSMRRRRANNCRTFVRLRVTITIYAGFMLDHFHLPGSDTYTCWYERRSEYAADQHRVYHADETSGGKIGFIRE